MRADRRHATRSVIIAPLKIDPGKVFDLTLPLEQVAEGYHTVDERRAITSRPHP